MRIVVFGTKKCKYCNIQKEHLAKTFPDEDWVYVDLEEDENALEIAEDLKLENIPTIVLLNDKSQEIFRKEGILPPDQIYQKLVGGNSCIPLLKEQAREINKNKEVTVLLSYTPKFNENQSIDAVTYGGEKICSANISQIEKIDINKNKNTKIAERYIQTGGRKDWAFKIKLTVN